VNDKIKIDLKEHFEHLPNAPIVEAAIEFRARATVEWEEKSIVAEYQEKVKGGSKVQSLKQSADEIKLTPENPPQAARVESGFFGVRIEFDSGKNVVHFTRDTFVFSRMAPYQDWGQLESETLRLWEIHQEIAKPKIIQRLGLRFINVISMPPNDVWFEHYIEPYPQPPVGFPLPMSRFFHQDVLLVPGHPYQITVIRTIQVKEEAQRVLLPIIDIDVSTDPNLDLGDMERLKKCLLEMRWLKNKVFFGSVTKKALATFHKLT
jgi:uncharacterized protein (TIGR04255 family)